MYDVGSVTHPGKVRHRNEDSCLVRTDTGMWAVADGMGGHDAGDVASRTVIEALDAVQQPSSACELLEQCKAQMLKAHTQIAALSKARGRAQTISCAAQATGSINYGPTRSTPSSSTGSSKSPMTVEPHDDRSTEIRP